MRGRRHRLQVSTFPFLAVLLCAMGSLILVLLVMDRKAHQAAQARAQREAARLAEESARSEPVRQAEREKLQQQARAEWERKRDALHEKLTREQIDMQLQMRKVREQLQQIAARLHYEQDTTTQLRRKTQDERSRLQAEEQLLRTLRSNAKQSEEQSKESSQALRRMTLDLLQMEQVLKDLKASWQRAQKTFSVVPYHGRRGENRRPIYVECTAQGVIFHPERKAMPLVALLPGSRDPANDARGEVERRIAQQRQKLAGLPDDVDKTPYLLLLLRPGGITTYHLFQAALKGQDLDFGYEFIDDDWVLDFPVNDELSSTQPWMIATKASPPSASASSAASLSPRAGQRPVGMAPVVDSGGFPAGGIRGFRGRNTGTISSTLSGVSKPPEAGSTPWAYASGSGNGTGIQGAFSTRSDSNGGLSGSQTPFGNSVRGAPLRASAPAISGTVPSGSQTPFGNPAREAPLRTSAPAMGGTTPQGFPSASSQVEPGIEGKGNNSRSLGYASGAGFIGRGHPSAMPSSGPGGDGEAGFSGQGSATGSGFQGTLSFAPRGPGSGNGLGYGNSSDSSSSGPSSAVPGLGPPHALSPAESVGNPASGSPTSVIAGNGSLGKGIQGNGIASNGAAGQRNPGWALGAGRYTTGGSGVADGNPSRGSSVPGEATQLSNSQLSRTQQPSPQFSSSQTLSGHPVRETPLGTSPSAVVGASKQSFSAVLSQAELGNEGKGTAGVGSGSDGGSALANPSGSSSLPRSSGGTPGWGNSGRSSDTVIFVDPVTGKPTAPPHPASASASLEERPPDVVDGNRDKPRVRVIVGNKANGGSDGASDNASAAMNRFAPTPSYSPPPRRSAAALRPVWVHGGRDWTIYVECRATDLVLYPSQRAFTLAQAMSDPAGNLLIKAIQQMIERRQSSRKPGEPPYHPQLCLLVRPEHIRTFLTVYPALEALPVPKTRRNLDADDDVISIVTGSVP